MGIELFKIIDRVYPTSKRLGKKRSREEIVDVLFDNNIPPFTRNATFFIRSKNNFFPVTFVFEEDEYYYERLTLAQAD